MKYHLLILSCCLLISAYTLPKDYWWILETSSEKSAYDDNGNFYWDINFSERVQALDGQKITLKGYFYTYQDTNIVLFTKNKQPFYGCSADPKVLMIELVNNADLKFKLHKSYQLEGVLELNKKHLETSSYTFPYRLKNCKIL